MIGIKLCGFQRVEDVRKAASLPIDAIGFILVPRRRRTVEWNQLDALIAAVPPQIKKVAVLKDASLEAAQKLTDRFPFDAIQLHGDETPAYCKELREHIQVALVKVFSVSKTPVLEELLPDYAPWIDQILLDSAGGGRGKAFDWSQIPHWKEAAKALKLPLWVAGGLHPDNVASLIESYRPDGVDVSSGIETDGRKDVGKMRDFVERVKGC